MTGFAPSIPLHRYIAVAETLTHSKLSLEERDWAATSRLGGIPASRFAGWLALSASSPLLPSAPPAEERSPLPAPHCGSGESGGELI